MPAASPVSPAVAAVPTVASIAVPLGLPIPVGRTRQKVQNPELISLLIGTRGRPQILANLLRSLEDTTVDKRLIEVWVYVDDDDRVTRDFIEALRASPCSFPVSFVIGPSPTSMGAMMNTLRAHVSTGPGILFPCNDKALFIELGWDRRVRAAFSAQPDRVALVYLMDDYHGPHFGGFCLLSAEWVNALGYCLTEFFPFWFDDTWLNQVAMLVGRRVGLPVYIALQGAGIKGRTMRMRNLPFWARFFENTLEERWWEAERLRPLVCAGDPAAMARNRAAGSEVATRFQRAPYSAGNLASLEEKFSAGVRADSLLDPLYVRQERLAIAFLLRKFLRCLDAGEVGRARVLLANVGLACWPVAELPAISASLDRRADAEARAVIARVLAGLEPAGGEVQSPVAIVSLPPRFPPRPANLQPAWRAGQRQAFRRKLLKRHGRYAILQFVSRFTDLFARRFFYPSPYAPPSFPGDLDSLRFYLGLWADFLGRR